MPLKKFRTRILDREGILSTLEALIPTMASSWGTEIIGEHGGVSDIPWEEHWQPQRFPVQGLVDHLQGEEATSGFRVSEHDYFIRDVDRQNLIHLCHEADIHFELSSGELKDRVLEVLNEKGIPLDE